jgi:hypothetical protein
LIAGASRGRLGQRRMPTRIQQLGLLLVLALLGLFVVWRVA